MMLPIVLSVLRELETDQNDQRHSTTDNSRSKTSRFSSTVDPGGDLQLTNEVPEETDFENFEEIETKKNNLRDLGKGLVLCIPFSASIGGTATLTGTPRLDSRIYD